ncbi:nicotinate phosphoribosyltransferase [Rhizopogon vinicolor AM-OR11-026]|uniref:Nicotinate phosphoribosyltransferase n=1 Tax=Rhizopogon vinicolor AM-OR11-026 TaxID=1314800 RepID=A0A1B7MXF6_9AGAM|nr:nicotinate phosphoribosyltransferase [Rhizopogon vinicolor AM-OR11-026]
MASNIDVSVPDAHSEFKVVSILDTDLYKFTMQQAVFEYYPTAQAVYRFAHRDKDRQLPKACIEKFEISLNSFAEIQLKQDERVWLQDKCNYFKPNYLNYLQSYRFKPEQITVNFIPSSNDPAMGSVEIEARGLWLETILWEVPLMACLSEIYFRYADQDWDYTGQEEQAMHKAKCLFDARCIFSDFGTRRRRSLLAHDLVLSGIIKAQSAHEWKDGFFGTSNAYFAMRYNLNTIGTIAHEWFMGIAAICNYKDSTGTALDLWSKLYGESLSVTLTDTFSTEVFYREFDSIRANQWKALRQDSGNPKAFAPRAKQMYEERGIDHTQKGIIYSDALDFNKAKVLHDQCQQLGFTKCSFGIGTWLTNDFKMKSSEYKEKSKALNMVIKLGSIDGKECVKISDEITKNTGVPEAVTKVKEIYQIPLS